ncbi:MAG: cobyrinate a,c-diamide synthase [Oscillospiraceae bacterium]|nr:cobyrinate a,c-diamide synthase [Oscillospiraceae bacterium]
MIRLLVSAPASGCGKTAVSCALLRIFRERGLNPCAFKCGPDYIDPMFHRACLNVESRNLDLFLSDAGTVRTQFARGCRGRGAAVIEGAMGYYDGLGGTTDRASARQLADTLDVPVLLVLPAHGAGLTLAAAVRGLQSFRTPCRIKAVILNDCSPALCRKLAPMLEQETGIPVLGCLPRVPEAAVESRHLGLLTAQEIRDLDGRLSALARAMEENVNLARLTELFDGAVPEAEPPSSPPPKRCRIAAARDEAFCFAYAETFETFAERGAEIVFFSPLHDAALPERIGGLYLPGGYPELYARRLSENAAMRRAVAGAVRAGLPTVAECGGFLYLGTALAAPDGERFPMAGVLPGEAADAGRLTRFGYAELIADRNSLLFRAGDRIPVHEFHRWDSTENGRDFRLRKPISGIEWKAGFAGGSLYAAFPHLYFAGSPILAERLIRAAEKYGAEHGTDGTAEQNHAAG